MSLIYAAVALLVAAQLLGIYALVTRKADLIFSLAMAVMLAVAVFVGGLGAYDKIH